MRYIWGDCIDIEESTISQTNDIGHDITLASKTCLISYDWRNYACVPNFYDNFVAVI